MPTETFDVVVKSFASTVAGTQNQANSENDLKVMVSISTTTRTNARIKCIVSHPWKFSGATSTTTSKLTVSADSDFPPESLIPPSILKIDELVDNEFDIIFATPLAQG